MKLSRATNQGLRKSALIIHRRSEKLVEVDSSAVPVKFSAEGERERIQVMGILSQIEHDVETLKRIIDAGMPCKAEWPTLTIAQEAVAVMRSHAAIQAVWDVLAPADFETVESDLTAIQDSMIPSISELSDEPRFFAVQVVVYQMEAKLMATALLCEVCLSAKDLRTRVRGLKAAREALLEFHTKARRPELYRVDPELTKESMMEAAALSIIASRVGV